jgi:hypothetical protein
VDVLGRRLAAGALAGLNRIPTTCWDRHRGLAPAQAPCGRALAEPKRIASADVIDERVSAVQPIEQRSIRRRSNQGLDGHDPSTANIPRNADSARDPLPRRPVSGVSLCALFAADPVG